MTTFDASFTCDLEPDCPPYLWTFRGVDEGMPRLLELLAALGIRSTFFTTGDVARRYPGIVRLLVDEGHELGCHGMSHTAFTEMDRTDARREIEDSATILRHFAPVTSFRAPYLRFPDEYLPLLEEAGFVVDSSQARYKAAYMRSRRNPVRTTLVRIPASLTSSALRIPRLLREAYVRAVRTPVVLFVHPWEFVDLRRTTLRYDCRFRTGDTALACVGDVLSGMQGRGARFRTIAELAAS